MSATTGNCIP